MFIYRAHCQRRVFMEAQLPYLQTKAFWKNPKKYFDEDGAIAQSMQPGWFTRRPSWLVGWWVSWSVGRKVSK